MSKHTDAVVVERHGRVAVMTINRPDVRNAIDQAVCQGLVTHANSLSGDATVGALVIHGAGDHAFSAGADLATVARLSGADKRRFVESAWRAVDTIFRLSLPTIAAIKGHALGGGLELCLACDVRLAEPDASLGLPEMTLGGVPAFGAVQLLPAIIGRGRAMDMMLNGRRVSADEAERIGLVTRVVPAGEVFHSALALAQQYAARPPEAVRYLKMALNAASPSHDAAGMHGMISDLCHSDPTYQEKIARFIPALGSEPSS